jgi:hypothetical protein
MALGESKWALIGPICDTIDIYEGPEVFLATFGQVRREAGLLYAAEFCRQEVDSGFKQFFFNSTGVLAPEAGECFVAIGQLQVANIIDRAIEVLGSSSLHERWARQAALNLLPPDSFKELSKALYALIDTEAGGFEVASDEFASRIPG